MRKDSMKFLEVLLKQREQTKEDVLHPDINDFNEIPNVQTNIREILKDLKAYGCIGEDSLYSVTGDIEIYLTLEGIEYFKNKETYNNGTVVTNNIANFTGTISNVQIQQGTINSNQTQAMPSMDFDKVVEFVSNIKKYDAVLGVEYGEMASNVREILNEVDNLAKQRGNPSKIKRLLSTLRELSTGVSGGIIASAIVDGVKKFLL
jgi:hypothetical protein